MTTILTTKGDGFYIKSVYLEEENTFAVVLEEDNNIEILEKIGSIQNLVEAHDVWAKFTGAISTSFTISQVGRHLTYVS